MTDKQSILDAFRGARPPRGSIVGAGAGTGISAKSAIDGGADFVVVYNSGKYRMAGRGSLAGLLPYGDANGIVLDMAAEVIPVSAKPVFAGVNGTDPFRSIPRFLRQVKDAGYQGVQNFPTVGVWDGIFRENLEATGMGYGLEVDMIRAANEAGLVTAPYAFTVEETEAMVADGHADILVTHLGLTSGGSVGAGAVLPLDAAVQQSQAMLDAARRIDPDVIVLAHGGPIATSEDWQYVFDRTEGFDGFLGASSMERLPVERGIAGAVRGFKDVARSTGTRS
ncbi:phosphoenolpyruvate hydrolase family protein [Curtobacterium sp. MCBD17_034]|uniref:phosphoenolpyruvate hydrolase family protein n=1 Tax=unclassified Curtobacterium TaxID=257496 RepID=UPI000DA96FE7|nr:MULTISPECIES: phosphoenolpyruvate hydrolase family protein [unclassified Curtobacterium]PZF62123.1 phosphoenolpyruvate hydrolase family protein [Curtobacterium sp. MCBD17_034]PZM33942.1 phosphoenolpyruvate hydrolase family protein [Curtobacterium sp. MCBD17_031]